jgi:hypothetical protein
MTWAVAWLLVRESESSERSTQEMWRTFREERDQ